MYGILMILLVLSSVMSLFVSSWFLFWILMELGLFWFIPTINKDCGQMSKSSLWQFFLIQVVSSSLILFFIVAEKSFCQTSSYSTWMSYGLFMSFFVKLGFPPFHSWGILVAEGLSLKAFVILNTILKFPPLVGLLNMSHFLDSKPAQIFAIFSSMVSVVSIWDLSVRRFFVYSSFVNLFWVVLGFFGPESVSLLFLFFYMLSFSLMMYLLESDSEKIMSKSFFTKNSYPNGFMIFIVFVNLVGMPPSILFFLKLDMAKIFLEMNMSMWVVMILVVTSIILASSYLLISHFRILWHSSWESGSSGMIYKLVIFIFHSILLGFLFMM
uniref:NADH-ubiquinone oxidoreductase chain 2 n=1 Tax=Pedicinus badii TaxID=430776 RepID=A0A7H1K1B1_9NEOP|nr:NADH dehydrogenase subunit 2 [Pedicinus badii]